jgi:hypothetical protein
LRPIAPFFDLLRPFVGCCRANIFNVIFKKLKILRPLRPCALSSLCHRCANIFNVIFKKLKILRPLRPCALFVFRNKKAGCADPAM